MFRGATSFKQVLCGEAWIDSKAQKANMFSNSPGSIAHGICFLPHTRENLIAAVDACLNLSPVGNCSTGPHGPIGEWDVSQVTNMDNMFNGAKSFNQDLCKWNVDKVTRMYGMFFQASDFNGDLSKWDVGQVTIMKNMFRNAKSFNQDLSKWNVGQVTNMRHMFNGAESFNQDLSKWNMGQVIDMRSMFRGATSFKQVLCGEAWIDSKAQKAN